MLATWLAIRCSGGNPSRKRMGVQLHAPGKHTRSPNPVAHAMYVNIFALLYCDDICLMANDPRDLQDMLGVVREFMTTMGIPIND
jgi:hypothetical protein